MRRNLLFHAGTAILLAHFTTGCDKLGLGQQAPVADGAPSEEELQKINYMASAPAGDQNRKVYLHYEEAKTCGNFELAMRWNRPPNIESGVFHKKMVYLTSTVPPDLPKNSEVFIAGKIEDWHTLPSGSVVWYVRMRDRTRLEVIETESIWEKQEQVSQEGKYVAIVKPEKPGRAFCAHGVYQGEVGKDPKQDKNIPLVSALFAMDRDK